MHGIDSGYPDFSTFRVPLPNHGSRNKKKIIPSLSTLTIAMLMVQKSIDGAVIYEAPVMFSAEVSVENGFAASEGVNSMSLDAPDYGEGVTL